jgi:basic membrane protein A
VRKVPARGDSAPRRFDARAARPVRIALLLLVLTAALVAAGCSDSGGGGGNETGEGGGSEASSASGGGEATGEATIGWVFGGEADQESVSAVETAFPDGVTSVVAEGAADEPGAAAQALVSQGATLVVSDIAGACAGVPETHCVEPGGGTSAGANAVALDDAFWNRAYLLGRAAGLLTESDTIAYVAAGAAPEETAAVNAFALGCQSANPNCIVRLASAPADPAKALRSLVKRNADVVATTLGDPALCEAAGTAARVQPVLAPGDLCGNAYAVAGLAAAVEPLVQAELAGEWQGGTSAALPIGEWASSVPPDVVTKVEDRAAEIEGGGNVFAGPLFDNEGNQQVPEGEELTPDFIASQWTWLLGGVLTR